ncbi:hypothetical protein [Chamaesiphon minutus]|uniref:Uncharacterized protein n=1 Tax=Chamaesiphon minutus (strain ATCC 27169 / PCC 6605) TaxID=1173020 RepID=K9UK34_CHAP6|nr:hypothetical protein [Chamaesiphon minutus]AFY94564.1 hypothetical protein Cha6605_3576 [Chamaesiphon minutus PCC 6605]
MSLRLECDNQGGVIIADRSFFQNPDPEGIGISYAFDIALDREGGTELICDFNEEWNQVWHRETLLLVNEINKGIFLFVTLPIGDFNLEILDNKIIKDDMCFFFESKIEVKTKEILLFEAGSWLEDIDIGDVKPSHKVELENGWYNIQIQIDNRIGNESEDSYLVGNMVISISSTEEKIDPLLELPCYQNWLSINN